MCCLCVSRSTFRILRKVGVHKYLIQNRIEATEFLKWFCLRLPFQEMIRTASGKSPLCSENHILVATLFFLSPPSCPCPNAWSYLHIINCLIKLEVRLFILLQLRIVCLIWSARCWCIQDLKQSPKTFSDNLQESQKIDSHIKKL